MPALHWASTLHGLVARNATAADPASDALQVVCAWPVSGQYGPGSRVLYYALVAACVFARKAEWLRNACLAAALLFPAIAALHGIVLACLHRDGAVDMDVYGAFQLCSIGILAAPVTARLSGTYFFDPGRNIIFLWTGLILAGLLSLTVEFFRSDSVPCFQDGQGNPISSDPGLFPYNSTSTKLCNLVCSVDYGPYSPQRLDAANNIYVIPAPDKLSFNTATLVAAACCIPAILSMVSMWNKILEINWKLHFGNVADANRVDELIEGTNGATDAKMKGVNAYIRRFLRVVEVPVFGAAILYILIVGEMNFFTRQMQYQTEPIVSVGQWAPIAGTGLALLGSLYLLLASDVSKTDKETSSNTSVHHCNCHHEMRDVRSEPSLALSRSRGESPAANDGEASMDMIRTATTRDTSRISNHSRRPMMEKTDAGGRLKVARVLTALSNQISTPAPDRYDDSEFKHGKALDFPEIPGEQQRNINLPQIKKQYNQNQDVDGNGAPSLRRQISRTGSFAGSAISRASVEGSSTAHGASPQSPQFPRHSSPSPSRSMLRRSRVSTLPTKPSSFEQPRAPSSPPIDPNRGRTRQRGNTLDVLSPGPHRPLRINPQPEPATSGLTVAGGQTSPAIVISSDPDTTSPSHSPLTATPPISP